MPMEVVATLAGRKPPQKSGLRLYRRDRRPDAIRCSVQGLNEKSRSAREAAITALIKVRDRLPARLPFESGGCGARELAGSPFVELLVESVEGAERDTKEAIVRVLGLIGDQRAAIPLCPECRDERLRKYGLAALENMGDAGMASLVERISCCGRRTALHHSLCLRRAPAQVCIPFSGEGMRGRNPDSEKLPGVSRRQDRVDRAD